MTTDDPDTVARERDRILTRIEAEVLPRLNRDPYDDDGGYNCCGCSTYRDIVDDIAAIVRDDEPAK